MSNYHSRGVVNRYWKRPKPKVYECNVRDAERFYQQSYKDYLEAKEYAAKRSSDDRISSVGDSSTSSWGVRRSNSLLDSATDPTSSFDSSSRSSYLNSRQYEDDSMSGTTSGFRTSTSRRTPDSDMPNIDDRLQRLQKLRSELGLPSETSGLSSSKVTFSTPDSTNTSSSISRRHISPDPRDRRGRTVDVSNGSSFSSTTLGNRSRASDLTSDSCGDKLSSGNERSSRFASKYNSSNEDASSSSTFKSRQNERASSYARDEPEKYSYKSSMKKERKYDVDDDDYSYKPSVRKERKYETSDDDFSFKPSESRSKVETSTFKSSRKAAASAINDDDDCDADAYLSSIKKKFPTSDEILERIKKMDSDI